MADIVLRREVWNSEPDAEQKKIKREILRLCSMTLAQHKVPSSIHFVSELGFSEAGKLARPVSSASGSDDVAS